METIKSNINKKIKLVTSSHSHDKEQKFSQDVLLVVLVNKFKMQKSRTTDLRKPKMAVLHSFH